MHTHCNTTWVTPMAKFILDDNGISMHVSMLSMVLGESGRWASVEVGSMDSWKKKTQKEQFPVFEKHLMKWICCVQLAQVTSDNAYLLLFATA
jgi:hypothetical protein